MTEQLDRAGITSSRKGNALSKLHPDSFAQRSEALLNLEPDDPLATHLQERGILPKDLSRLSKTDMSQCLSLLSLEDCLGVDQTTLIGAFQRATRDDPTQALRLLLTAPEGAFEEILLKLQSALTASTHLLAVASTVLSLRAESFGSEMGLRVAHDMVENAQREASTRSAVLVEVLEEKLQRLQAVVPKQA